MRLDIYLTRYHNIQSRNKAAELIKNKKVKVNDKIITKSSFNMEDEYELIILENEFYVSRSAKKLKYFLEEIQIELKEMKALDIGSSTGGFTQILLENNVKNVTCLDVGTNQLHTSIKDDKRIIKQENTDIRKFDSKYLFEIITCDVSFISILNILANINQLAQKHIIILYKPQFEVGSTTKRNSAGVVQDDIAIANARQIFLEKTKEYNWKLIYNNMSKVTGKNGNIEELFYFETT
jgi:23S rRNA (cytidine1920-2'-O)/16S rRNA (cytidine1409-2'-O)-methyltransferase